MIHRRDAPRSIRGQRNSESHDGRPRSVRGQDPEYRKPKRKWRRTNFPPLKPLRMVFCIQTAQAPSRSIFCFFNQTSEWTTTTRLLHNKPLFARSSRVLRRSDSSKGRQLGLPSRTSNLIGAGHIDIITFLEKKTVLLVIFLCFVCFPLCIFPVMSTNLPKQGRKAIAERSGC